MASATCFRIGHTAPGRPAYKPAKRSVGSGVTYTYKDTMYRVVKSGSSRRWVKISKEATPKKKATKKKARRRRKPRRRRRQEEDAE